MRRVASVVTAIVLAGAALLFSAGPADAHVTTVAYADLTSAGATDVRVEFDLQYELLSASAAAAARDPALFDAAIEHPRRGAEDQVLATHLDAILDYTTSRFRVSVDGGARCAPHPDGPARFHTRDATDYARFAVRYVCGAGHGRSGHGGAFVVRSSLFPDSEGMVTGTKTIVTYALDGRSGTAALDTAHPQFSTAQSWTARFAEFFLLGAEHLLTGLDHILFLVALIISSRRLRDVVLAATCFTVAHSITLLLAALGVVHVGADIVEPAIALSIAAVAGWHLGAERRRRAARRRGDPEPAPSRRAGLLRLGIVFGFGLVHGLGFATALKIDEPWSWTLLWSLLVFNLGIEAVQLAVILVVFPPLLLLRRRLPRTATVLGVAITAIVLLCGVLWFAMRVLSLPGTP